MAITNGLPKPPAAKKARNIERQRIAQIIQDLDSERVSAALSALRLDSLIRIVAAAIRSYFSGGWLCSPLERSFLERLQEETLEFPRDEF